MSPRRRDGGDTDALCRPVRRPEAMLSDERLSQLRLSFPERTDLAGGSHPIIRPVDDNARRQIESQIFEALGLENAGVSQ